MDLIHDRDLALLENRVPAEVPYLRQLTGGQAAAAELPAVGPAEGPPGAGTTLLPAEPPAPQPSSPRAERAASEEQARLPRQGAGSHRSSDEPQSYAPSTSWDSEVPK